MSETLKNIQSYLPNVLAPKYKELITAVYDGSFAVEDAVNLKKLDEQSMWEHIGCILKFYTKATEPITNNKKFMKIYTNHLFTIDPIIKNCTVLLDPRFKMLSKTFDGVPLGECVGLFKFSLKDVKTFDKDNINKKYKIFMETLKGQSNELSLNIKGEMDWTDRHMLYKKDERYWEPSLAMDSDVSIVMDQDDSFYLYVRSVAEKSLRELLNLISEAEKSEMTIKAFIEDTPYYDLHMENCVRNLHFIARCFMKVFDCSFNSTIETMHNNIEMEVPVSELIMHNYSIDTGNGIESTQSYIKALYYFTTDSTKRTWNNDRKLLKEAFECKEPTNSPLKGTIVFRFNMFPCEIYGSSEIVQLESRKYLTKSNDIMILTNGKQFSNYGVDNYVSYPVFIDKGIKPSKETKHENIGLLNKTLSKNSIIYRSHEYITVDGTNTTTHTLSDDYLEIKKSSICDVIDHYNYRTKTHCMLLPLVVFSIPTQSNNQTTPKTEQSSSV